MTPQDKKKKKIPNSKNTYENIYIYLTQKTEIRIWVSREILSCYPLQNPLRHKCRIKLSCIACP